jgi:hypothetical protein
MMIRTWSIKHPLLSGVLVASALSQSAGAAELPAIQPLPTPGIPTPDQAVRQMANGVVLDSKAAALSRAAQPINNSTGVDRYTPSHPISPLPLTASLPNPSRVLSNCPINVCGFRATQPPVTLGTALPGGINSTAQNNLTSFNSNTPDTASKIAKVVDLVPPQTATPQDQVANAARNSTSPEPKADQDIASGQPAKTSNTDNADQPIINYPPKVAEVTTSEKAISIGSVQRQITSFTGQLVANSWRLITVLPKPQLDTSLLNIGSDRPFQQADSLSFSPRFILGTTVAAAPPTNLSRSLQASPLFSATKPGAKIVSETVQWPQSSFLTRPNNSSKLSKYQGFASINRSEPLIKSFNVMNFLATLNTSTLSSNSLRVQSY